MTIRAYQNDIVRIKKAVSEASGFGLRQLDSPRRPHRLCVARWICWKLMRERGYGFQAIGASFNRHNSTVIDGLKSLENELQYGTKREALKREIELLRKRVNAT